ncbi:MAG TPA: MFS transporter [Marmoricola sp.]|nr:MFS transporter [Marmoricola sp.]
MKRRTPLRGWLTAEAISLTGTRISMIAIPWLVLTTTGSAAKTGIVTFAEMAPLVLCKALAGPIVDRLGPRRVALFADFASVLVVGAVPLLHVLDLLHFPTLVVIVAVAGALRGPGDGAKQALVPDLVAHGGVSLERATGLGGAVERGATMSGAALAAALVAVIGAANALVVDAVSFAASGVVLALSTRGLGAPKPPEDVRDPVTVEASYLRDLKDGWDFLRRDPVLVAIVTMVAVTNLIDQAYSALLVPVWAKDSGNGVAAIGAIGVAWGATALVGSVLAAKYAERLPRFKTYVIAFVITGVPRFAVLAMGAPLWAVLAVSVVGGFGSGFINPVLGAVIFERIPAPMMGRVTSLNSALCWALIPFGGMVGGVLVAGAGLAPALWVAGAAYFVTTMLPTVQPQWREMDKRRSVPAEAPEPART